MVQGQAGGSSSGLALMRFRTSIRPVCPLRARPARDRASLPARQQRSRPGRSAGPVRQLRAGGSGPGSANTARCVARSVTVTEENSTVRLPAALSDSFTSRLPLWSSATFRRTRRAPASRSRSRRQHDGISAPCAAQSSEWALLTSTESGRVAGRPGREVAPEAGHVGPVRRQPFRVGRVQVPTGLDQAPGVVRQLGMPVGKPADLAQSHRITFRNRSVKGLPVRDSFSIR